MCNKNMYQAKMEGSVLKSDECPYHLAQNVLSIMDHSKDNRVDLEVNGSVIRMGHAIIKAISTECMTFYQYFNATKRITDALVYHEPDVSNGMIIEIEYSRYLINRIYKLKNSTCGTSILGKEFQYNGNETWSYGDSIMPNPDEPSIMSALRYDYPYQIPVLLNGIPFTLYPSVIESHIYTYINTISSQRSVMIYKSSNGNDLEYIFHSDGNTAMIGIDTFNMDRLRSVSQISSALAMKLVQKRKFEIIYS